MVTWCTQCHNSLRAGSPLNHARERRKAKRSRGKESGEEVPKACLKVSLINFFISASLEQSEIPLVEKRERRENCQSIIFDDPHVASSRRSVSQGAARCWCLFLQKVCGKQYVHSTLLLTPNILFFIVRTCG